MVAAVPLPRETPENLRPHLITPQGVLYHADCLNVLESIQSSSIQCVFADPPFNLGKMYGSNVDDRLTEQAYLNWCFRWIDECCRVLAPSGALFIYALPRWAYHFAAHLEMEGMTFRHWIALTMKSTYPRGQKLYPAHYALLYFTKGKPRVFHRLRTPVPTCRHCKGELKDYGGHRDRLHPDGLNLTDFWEDTSPNRHRTTKARPGVNELKPMIPSRAIQIATDEGDIVLDPFGGGGSTFQEAERLGRFWIGSEIGDCGVIVERMQPFTTVQQPHQRLQAIFRR